MKNIIKLVFFLTSVLLISGCNALKQPTPDPLKNKSYFGINGTKAMHIPDQLNTTVKQRIEWMKELGITWDRSDWWWNVVEPQKNKFDFKTMDKLVKYFKENNIKIYPILCYGAKWWKDRNAPINDKEIEDFVYYVRVVVSRYKNDFKYWSIWNEPNIPNFWQPTPNPEMYTKLLKETYNAIKNIDPNAVVCAPALAPIGHWDKAYFEKMCQLGCFDYFDIFDYHYYRESAPELDVANEINQIKAIMAKYGVQKPIWISETGVTSDISQKPESYKDQASLIVRNQLICLANGVEKIFYFDLQNWDDNKNSTWDSKLGLVEAGGEKKPAFHAYKTIIKQVDHKKIIGMTDYLGKNIESVLYYDNDTEEYSMAVWTKNNKISKNVSIFCNSQNIKITDIYGKENIAKSKTDSKETYVIKVNISKYPKYIHNVSPEIYLPKAGIKIANPIVELPAGESVPFKIEIDPLLNATNIEITAAKLPNGLKYNSRNKTLHAAEDMTPGKKNITLTIKTDAEINGIKQKIKTIRKATVNIIPIMNLSIRPFVTGKNEINVKLTLTNNSNKTLNGPISVYENINGKPKKIAQSKKLKVRSGKSLNTNVRIDPAIFNNYSREIKWYAEFKNNKSLPFRIYTVTKLKKAPKIDGKLSDWKNIPYMKVNKKSMLSKGKTTWTPDRVSAKIKIAVTGKAVYLAADITDNDPAVNKNKPIKMYRGDSLDLYIGFCGPNTKSVIDKKQEFQIGITPTNSDTKKPMVFLYHYDRPMKNAVVKSLKTKKGYTLEAKIPYKDLFDVSVNDKKFLGLDIKLNDIDNGDWAPAGVSPGRSLMWGGGQNTMNWIDPSGWSMGIIKNT